MHFTICLKTYNENWRNGKRVKQSELYFSVGKDLHHYYIALHGPLGRIQWDRAVRFQIVTDRTSLFSASPTVAKTQQNLFLGPFVHSGLL